MENNLVSIDELKSLYFKDENKLFSKTSKKQDFHIKSTTEILSTIASQKDFQKIKSTYILKKYLSKILLKSHLEWITFVYYKEKKLIIGAKNHIGQSELNMQKYTLLQNLKTIEAYKEIEGVNIIRDEKFAPQEKEKKKRKKDEEGEKSYGIFENNITDTRQFAIVERIKKYIRNNNSLNIIK